MWLRILAFLLIAAALAGVLVYSQHRPRQERVSGFIEAHDIRVDMVVTPSHCMRLTPRPLIHLPRS